jgi:hypothetical protein
VLQDASFPIYGDPPLLRQLLLESMNPERYVGSARYFGVNR